MRGEGAVQVEGLSEESEFLLELENGSFDVLLLVVVCLVGKFLLVGGDVLLEYGVGLEDDVNVVSEEDVALGVLLGLLEEFLCDFAFKL